MKFHYRLKVVNPDKSIVSLSPTLGTYVKAFAPTIVLLVAAGVLAALDEKKTPETVDEDPFNLN